MNGSLVLNHRRSANACKTRGLAGLWDRLALRFCPAHHRFLSSLRMIAPHSNQGKTDSSLWRQLQFLIAQSCYIRFTPWKLAKWGSPNLARTVHVSPGPPARWSVSPTPRVPGAVPRETTAVEGRHFSRSWDCFGEKGCLRYSFVPALKMICFEIIANLLQSSKYSVRNFCVLHLHPDALIVNVSLHLFTPTPWCVYDDLCLPIPIIISLFLNHLKLSCRYDALSLLNTPVFISQNPGCSPHNYCTTLQIRKSTLIQHHHPIPKMCPDFTDSPNNDPFLPGPGRQQGACAAFVCLISLVSSVWNNYSVFLTFMSSMILKYRLYILQDVPQPKSSEASSWQSQVRISWQEYCRNGTMLFSVPHVGRAHDVHLSPHTGWLLGHVAKFSTLKSPLLPLQFSSIMYDANILFLI